MIADMKFELPRQPEEHYKKLFMALHDEVRNAFLQHFQHPEPCCRCGCPGWHIDCLHRERRDAPRVLVVHRADDGGARRKWL